MDEQWICAGLSNGARHGPRRELPNGCRILVALGSEVFPYGLIGHEIQTNLRAVNFVSNHLIKRDSHMVPHQLR